MLKKILSILINAYPIFTLPLIGSTCNPLYPSAPAPSSAYTTFTFGNQSLNPAITDANVFITVVGSTSSYGPLTNFILFNTLTGEGTLSSAEQTLPLQYYYSLDSLPKDGNNHPYVFMPSGLSQGILYIGIDYGVVLQTVQNGPSWQINPATSANTDANVYHFYDSIPFVTAPFTQFLGTNLENAYALPLSVLVTYNNGGTTFYLGMPPSVPRDDTTINSVFGSYNSALDSIAPLASQEQWAHAVSSFTAAGNNQSTSYLRLISPLFLIENGLFDPYYLFDAKYGSNWFTTVFGNNGPNGIYQKGVHDLYLDASSLGPNYTTYHYETTSSTGALIFSSDGIQPGGGGTVILGPTVSQPFFSSSAFGTNSFNAQGGAAEANLVCQYLSDGFVTGIFPTASSAENPLNNVFLQKQYVKSPTSFWGKSNPGSYPAGGPWYNLYAAVLHDLAPFNSTNTYSNINPQTADNSMGFNQPIPPTKPSNTATVGIILGNMQNSTIPNFLDGQPYDIQIAPAPGVTAIYNSTYIIGPDSQAFSNVTQPFSLIIEYGAGPYQGLTYATDVYVYSPSASYYGFAYPQPPAPLLPSFSPNPSPGLWNIGIGHP